MNLKQLQILKAEITDDPLSRGYSGMNNHEIASDLNTQYRERNLNLITATEIFNAINKSEFNALPDSQKQIIWNILHMGEVNPFGLEKDIFVDIFGAGSETITSLAGIRKVPQSRAAELGLSEVSAGYVADAKNL